MRSARSRPTSTSTATAGRSSPARSAAGRQGATAAGIGGRQRGAELREADRRPRDQAAPRRARSRRRARAKKRKRATAAREIALAERTVGPRTAGVLEASDTANGMPLPVLLALVALGAARHGRGPFSCSASASRASPARSVVAGSRALAASAALGALLAAIAFGAKGGTELGRTTTVEVLIVLVAGAGLALAVLYIRPGPALRAVALGLFGLLALITGLSMTWSIGPDLSLEETVADARVPRCLRRGGRGRRSRPDATAAVLGGVLVASAAVAGWALVTRIWPEALAENVLGARLSGRWSTGTRWERWRRSARRPRCGSGRAARAAPLLRALAYPAMGVLVLTVLLTQSRGALAAAVLAAIAWIAVRAAPAAQRPRDRVPALAVAPVAAWALSKDAFTQPLQPASAREAVAGDFGLMLAGAAPSCWRRAWRWASPARAARRRWRSAAAPGSRLAVVLPVPVRRADVRRHERPRPGRHGLRPRR